MEKAEGKEFPEAQKVQLSSKNTFACIFFLNFPLRFLLLLYCDQEELTFLFFYEKV